MADSPAAALAAVAAALFRAATREEMFVMRRRRRLGGAAPDRAQLTMPPAHASADSEAAVGSRHDKEGSALILLVARAL